jgi:hypothetical protein
VAGNDGPTGGDSKSLAVETETYDKLSHAHNPSRCRVVPPIFGGGIDPSIHSVSFSSFNRTTMQRQGNLYACITHSMLRAIER